MTSISALLLLVSFFLKTSSPISAPIATEVSTSPSPTGRSQILTLAPTVAPEVFPTASPVPSTSPLPMSTTTPQPTVQAKASNSILEKINAYRASHGLSPVSESAETCAYAQLRANELVNSFNHEGTGYPYSYSEVTENIAMTTSPNEVVDLWINSPAHAENMRKNTPFVCVKNNGPYYAYEGLRP